VQRSDRDAKVRDVIVKWLAHQITEHDALCAIAHLYSPTLVPGRPDTPIEERPPF
jgi:hypothetical protein